MAAPLPRLRMNLEFMPSPVEDRPGLLIRDSFHYSDATLIIPPELVELLEYFDGDHTSLDLRQRLVDLTGDLSVSDLQDHLTGALAKAGFLEDDTYHQLKEASERAFAESPFKIASHAGSAYPDDATELREVFSSWIGDGHDGQASAIAAPHVSPVGGWNSYRAAYRALNPADRDRTFVILGTSHYGAPDVFGLTRKDFATPYGEARTARHLVDELASKAPGAILMEDYCHAIEHSIEFQVVFLQHVFGPEVKILPILCGPFAKSIYEGGLPEQNPEVERMFGALGELAAREGNKLCWVLGVDMAHMGRRYGDQFDAIAGEREMTEVARQDQLRIDAINAWDARAYWDRVQLNQDNLKWCGSSPFYTFLKSAPPSKGQLIHYEQWNIDEQSVVSFAGMSFV